MEVIDHCQVRERDCELQSVVFIRVSRETELLGVAGSPVTFAVHSFCPLSIMINRMHLYVYIHTDGEREIELYFQELTHETVGLASLNSTGQGGGVDTQKRVDVAVLIAEAVWRQRSLFLR